jgi:hypothetical protein
MHVYYLAPILITSLWIAGVTVTLVAQELASRALWLLGDDFLLEW